MEQLIRNSAKLGIAATTILLIGSAFLILNPEKENVVQPAKADIFMFGDQDAGAKFREAVIALGIRPRPYDFNGNVMFFGNSRIHRSASAMETANIVQEQLVDFGVNKKNYLEYETLLNLDMKKSSLTKHDPKSEEYRAAMLKGELVPTRKDKNVVEMSGVVGIESVEDFDNRMKQLSPSEKQEKSLTDFMTGYRYIEVRQEPGKTNAEILAVYTDENFDGNKMANKPGTQQSPPDPKIPACIGCSRVRRVQALDKTEPYNINKWVTHSTLDETYSFYKKSMSNRGWKESGRQQMFNKLAEVLPELQNIRGRSLSLEKNGELIEITILPSSNGGSEVFSLEQYSDVQPTLEKLPIEPNSTARDTIRNFFK